MLCIPGIHGFQLPLPQSWPEIPLLPDWKLHICPLSFGERSRGFGDLCSWATLPVGTLYLGARSSTPFLTPGRCTCPDSWAARLSSAETAWSSLYFGGTIETGVTEGRKPQLPARWIITSSFHPQPSDPGSLVIPQLIYTQNMDILCKEPEVIGACTAGLNSVSVPVQVLWSSSLFTCWDSGDSACLSQDPHLFLCLVVSQCPHLFLRQTNFTFYHPST